MSPRSTRDQARVLLGKAEGDLAAARALQGAEEVLDAAVGFHAQQAAEKALKAVLAARDVEYPFTHDIGWLLKLIERSGSSPPSEPRAAESLVPWAMELRYEAPEDVPPLDRQGAIEIAEAVLAWAQAQVSSG